MSFLRKEWIEDYFRKSGDEGLRTENLTVTEWGFASWDFFHEEKVLWVYCVYGDGRKWKRFFLEVGRELGAEKIRFSTRQIHRVSAFRRLFGARVCAVVLEADVV